MHCHHAHGIDVAESFLDSVVLALVDKLQKLVHAFTVCGVTHSVDEGIQFTHTQSAVGQSLHVQCVVRQFQYVQHGFANRRPVGEKTHFVNKIK